MDNQLTRHADVELREGYVYFSVKRGQPLSLTVEAAKAAVALCHEQNIFKVLVNIGQLDNRLSAPGNVFQLVSEMSALVDRRLKIAVVNSVGWLPLANFARMVARNRGLNFTIFTTNAEALNWLLQEEPA